MKKPPSNKTGGLKAVNPALSNPNNMAHDRMLTTPEQVDSNTSVPANSTTLPTPELGDQQNGIPGLPHHDFTWFDDCHDQESIPEWMMKMPDKGTCRQDETHGFWYETEEDHENGLSQACHPGWEQHPSRTYRFGGLGCLGVTLMDGKAWCSLDDAGRLTGLSTHEITGWLPEDEIHVRGLPGHLDPDGYRIIYQKPIMGYAIRLEALLPVVVNVRGGRQLKEWLLQTVLPDIYSDSGPSEAELEPVDGHSTMEEEDVPAPPGMIRQYVYYRLYWGELRAIRLGLHVWLAVDDVSGYISLDQKVIVKLAGERRVTKVSNTCILDNVEREGTTTYIRQDAVQRLADGKEWDHRVSYAWSVVYSKGLGGKAILSEPREFVHATTLCRALDRNLDLKGLLALCESANPGIRKEFDSTGDFRISIAAARNIAMRVNDFAGLVTAHLLNDGGFLHGGPIDEPADSTLERFRGLLPDCGGRVEVRKIWEFLNVSESFDNWFRRHDEMGFSYQPVCEGLVNIRDCWCHCIWGYAATWSERKSSSAV